MAGALAKVTAFLREDLEQASFENQRADIVKSINSLHWFMGDNTFCDATINEDGIHTFVCHKG